MAKKSRKNRKDNNIVHPAFEAHEGGADWHPLDSEINGRRDQKYVKNIKPRSDGQAELMKAIDTHSLSLAIGPAGTGKTYIAIAKAAEALEKGQIEREDGTIEIAPIGFMRGRTLNNSFVVIDEAQNCTYGQLKMILSRLGWHSTMVITGDPRQSDLLEGMSGLDDISKRLDAVPNIAVCRLSNGDIVRHPLVAEMLDVL